MRLHWSGVYGFGMVACTLGFIWLPQHRWEFVMSFLVLSVAALVGIVTADTHETGTVELMETEPETLVRSGYDGEDKVF